MALKLRISFFDNPLLDPLRDGTVRPGNIDLEVVMVNNASMLFYRNLAYSLEFDA